MIVQCPNCQSKSRVDDAGAARGARVRCASCAHVFLPNTAIVSPKPAAQPAQAAAAAAAAEEEFGGKTSMFTGVVARDLVGLTAPAAAAPKPLGQPKSAEPTLASAPPRDKLAPPPAAAPSDEGFGGGSNRTQAIDVSQLAAFSAKMPAAAEPKAAPHSGLAPAAAAKPRAAASNATAAPVKLAAVLEAESTATPEESGTAVVGTHEPGLLSAGVTSASRVLGGMSLVAGLCGFLFFAAGNAVYAAAGLMGGSHIDIAEAQTPTACVEQVTSALYVLADGHEALVALGTVGNPGSVQGPRMEVEFSLTDSTGTIVSQSRGPIGAVLSLEELATITLPDSAAAELRRRVQNLPPLAPHSHDRKFMAVIIKDPRRSLADMTQRVTLVAALPPEAAPPSAPPQAANTAPQASDDDAIMDPELPQTAIPAPVQAVSAMPPGEPEVVAPPEDATPSEPAAPSVVKARKKAATKTKRRR